MSNYKTEQEKFWAGTFGDNYISRNESRKLLASNISFFSEIIDRTSNIKSILELSANIGMNILALNNLLPDSETSAVEINSKAYEQLKSVCTGEAFLASILDMDVENFKKYDLVFTKGVLIHINPEALNNVYDTLYQLSDRYICVAEYYNPFPVIVDYRGEKDKLFKRDFAGDLMSKYKDLELVDYGFKYRKDPNYPQDDITWFLLEKK